MAEFCAHAAAGKHFELLLTHRWFLYLVFVFLLGAICTREALRYDFLIAEKVISRSSVPAF